MGYYYYYYYIWGVFRCTSEVLHHREEDSQCPICLMCMVEGESLVSCEAGCRNQLHHHCMAVWAADRHAQGQPVLCPLCRAPWPLKHNPRLAPAPPTVLRLPPTTSAPVAQDLSYSVMSASFSGELATLCFLCCVCLFLSSIFCVHVDSSVYLIFFLLSVPLCSSFFTH